MKVINFFGIRFILELVTIFGSEISFKWDELLFGLVRSDSLSVKNKHLIGILSLAARKAITKKWLNPDIPSVDEWYDIIYEVFVMERITNSLRLRPHPHEDKTLSSFKNDRHKDEGVSENVCVYMNALDTH